MWLDGCMQTEKHSQHLIDAAALFKLLGNESRLQIMLLLAEREHTVSELVAVTGMSQPLISQHLRGLREGGLVKTTRSGKSISYKVADSHVAHVITDAVEHVSEH